MAATQRIRPSALDAQHDDIGQRKETRHDLPQTEKLSVLKTRPWINKPIEDLTEFVSDGRTGKYIVTTLFYIIQTHRASVFRNILPHLHDP